MKYFKLLMVIYALVFFASSGYCDPASFQKKLNSNIKLIDSNSVAKRANNANSSLSSPYSEVFSNPIVNSALYGYGNMLQSSNGGTYSTQEQTRQQMDYARQQVNNNEADDE